MSLKGNRRELVMAESHMGSNQRRRILCLDPVKSKMTYYIDACHDGILDREIFSFNYMIDDILEQISQCVDKQGGLYENDRIRIDVKVSYKKS
jgi:hypothetical protein